MNIEKIDVVLEDVRKLTYDLFKIFEKHFPNKPTNEQFILIVSSLSDALASMIILTPYPNDIIKSFAFGLINSFVAQDKSEEIIDPEDLN